MNIAMSLRSLMGDAGMRDPRAWFPFMHGTRTESGADVSPDSALRVSAYFAMLRNLGEDTASLPLAILEKTNKGREKRQDHAAHNLMNRRADQFMSATNFRASWMMAAPGWGGAYALIERDPGGQPLRLRHINSAYYLTTRDVDAERWYFFQVPGEPNPRAYPDRHVLHLYGVGPTGYGGYSLAGMAAEALGLSIQAEKFGAKFYANNAVPSVALTFPESKKLDKAAVEFALAEWELMAGGANAPKARGVRPLFNGMDVKTFAISPNDSQFLETRQHQVEEIARWGRMPLHMIGHLLRSTNNNIEHQGLEYVTYTLRAWLKRIEDECWIKLLSEREQDAGLYFEHNVAALLRGDMAAQSNFFRVMQSNGNMSINEVRELMNMNGIGPEGDTYMVPVFVQPIEAAIQKAEAEAMKADALAEKADDPVPVKPMPGKVPPSIGGGNERDNPKPKPGAVMAPVIEAALRRVTVKAMKATAQAMKTHAEDPGGFQRWKKEFFGKMGAETAAELRAAAKALAELLGKEASPIMNAFAEFAERRVESQAVMATAPGAAETWADNIPAEVAEIIELIGVDHATD